MKREIKFRCWNIPSGIMYDWDTLRMAKQEAVWKWMDVNHEKDNNVLMQYTGLKDKNGVEIYEGDIIEFDREEWRGYDNIHVVTWDNEEGEWNWGGGSTSDMCYRTIIGNIHQHPHLLKHK